MKTEPYRSRSLAPGVVISLLIHAGLLALLVSQRPAPPAPQPVRWLTVSLVPAPAPRPAVEPEPVPQPALNPAVKPERPPGVRDHPAPIARAPVRAPATPRPDQAQEDETERRQEATAITVMPPAASDPADPFAVPPPRPAGTFDTTAALQSARKLALAKAGKDDPANAQLRDKPVNGLASENELGKGIQQAARPGCLMSGAGAGLLAPLVIAAQVLTDKKDHGCKW